MKLTLDDIRVNFVDDVANITILAGDDVGIVFNYGKVDFGEEEDSTLNFEYNVVSGTPRNYTLFEESIATLLLAMIEQSIKENSTVFSNGV